MTGGSDPYNTPACTIDCPDGDIDTAGLLDEFLSWHASSPVSVDFPHDHALLVSGLDFSNSAMGLSITGGICKAGSSGAVIEATSSNELLTSLVLTREIGHNFGVLDDAGDCQGHHIMSSNIQPGFTGWSNCSKEQLDTFLDNVYGTAGNPACLENLPALLPICGNGIVEAEEECDSGVGGLDPCCDSSTCRLSDGAACSSTDPCCTHDTCQITGTAVVCRAASSECDQPETCNGFLSTCPADVVRPAGTSCTVAVSSPEFVSCPLLS